MATVAEAQCASHPARAAVAPCHRCGRFLCEVCLELRGDAGYCGACARRLDVPAPPAVRAALFLTALSFPGLVLLSFVPLAGLLSLPLTGVAWLLGTGLTVAGRARLGRGELPERSGVWLRAAMFFSVLWGLALAALLAFVALVVLR